MHVSLQEFHQRDGSSFDLPERAQEARAQGKRGDVVRLGEGPVVGGEGPRQRALPQGDDEVDAPEERHGVVDLQVEEVPLEQTLVVVLDEDAAGKGAARVVRRGEVLRRGRRENERTRE